jgi:ATP-binding cassette subfamily C (CFTR/MRP) protein 1
LSKWADKNIKITMEENEDHKAEDVSYYLTVYAILGIIELVLKFGNDLTYFFRCAQASKVVHKNLLNNVLKSPMKFFDTNPIGRIVNRFTSDLDTMDQMIPFALMDFIWCLMECITIVLLISVTTPPFIGIMVPLIGIYFFIQKIYITSSRQIKRLYSISKSPIFSHFTETTNGASTIRAYKQQKRFIQDSQDKVSVNVTSIYLNFMSNLWMGTILENLGNLMIFFAAL